MAFGSPVPVPLFREAQDVLVDSSEGLLYWFPSGYLSSGPSWVRRADRCHRMQCFNHEVRTDLVLSSHLLRTRVIPRHLPSP